MFPHITRNAIKELTHLNTPLRPPCIANSQFCDFLPLTFDPTFTHPYCWLRRLRLPLNHFNIIGTPRLCGDYTYMNPANGKLRKPAPTRTRAPTAAPATTSIAPAGQYQERSLHHIPSMHWLFRSNIPRKRSSYIATDIKKRNFFGMGEIVGVLANVSGFFVIDPRRLMMKLLFWLACRDCTFPYRIKKDVRRSET